MQVMKGRLLAGQVKGCLKQLATWLTANLPLAKFTAVSGNFEQVVVQLSEGIELVKGSLLRAQLVTRVGGEYDSTIHGDDGMMLPTSTSAERQLKATKLKEAIAAGTSDLLVASVRARLLRLETTEHHKTALLLQGPAKQGYLAVLQATLASIMTVAETPSDPARTRLKNLIDYSDDEPDLSAEDGLQQGQSRSERFALITKALLGLSSTSATTIRSRLLDLGTAEALKIGGSMDIAAIRTAYSKLLTRVLQTLKPVGTPARCLCDMCGVHGSTERTEGNLGSFTPKMCDEHWHRALKELGILDRKLKPGEPDFAGSLKQYVERFGPRGCRVCEEVDLSYKGHPAFCFCTEHKLLVDARLSYATLGKVTSTHDLYV